MASNELLYLVIGIVLGILGDETIRTVDDHVRMPLPPEELETISEDMRATAKRAEAVATVADRLAQGEDVTDIIADMPDDVRADFEDYLRKRGEL